MKRHRITKLGLVAMAATPLLLLAVLAIGGNRDGAPADGSAAAGECGTFRCPTIGSTLDAITAPADPPRDCDGEKPASCGAARNCDGPGDCDTPCDEQKDAGCAAVAD